MVNNSSNINKPKESLNSDDQHFIQYQQTKRKFEQWGSTIPPISTNQNKVWTVMVNNSFNINKTKECMNSDGRQFLQYQQTKRKFKQWWSTIPPISTNQMKVLAVMEDNSTNINKPKESLNSYGQQFYQYQQNKRKFKQWWSTIPPISTNQKKVEQWWSTILPISTNQRKV